MPARLSSLLIGALALLAPDLSAQKSAACPTPSISAAYFHGRNVESRVWIAGFYENVTRQVYVPGPFRRVWVEPVYGWRLGLFGPRYVCVRAGYWKTIQLPGHYETRCERVVRPGRWAERACD